MNPITQETSAAIAMAHREVVAGEKLLAELRNSKQWRDEPDFRDAFGHRQRELQLGIPSGNDGHRLFGVSWTLAVPVIEAHLARKRAEIMDLSMKARIEMDAVPPLPVAQETP